MKISKYIILFSLVAFSLASCSDFLDVEPVATETEENFFNDEQNAIYALNACYDVLAWDEGDKATHNYEFIFGDVLSDDAEKGSMESDFPEIQEMKEWRTTSTNGVTSGLWNNMFTGIHRCNVVIKNIEGGSIDEALKTRLMGEARFLRAYYYFYLVKVFGGVPLFTEPVKPSEFGTTPRGSISETYAQIEEDFNYAISALPEKNAYDVSDMGRATKGAATAFLARAIMYQLGTDNLNNHTWQEVYDLTNSVISSGQYSLAPNYATIYEMEGENGPGSIFEVQCASVKVDWGPGKGGTTASVFQGNRGDWGWGFNNPTQNFVDAFEADDPRLACSAYGDGAVVHGVALSIDLAENMTGYLNRKAALEPAFRPSSSKDSPANIRKFRFADIILMNAEAAYHIGNEDVARNRVNMIRERARNSTRPKGFSEGSLSYESTGASNLLPDITAAGDALLDAILHERRVELGMESLRFWDLVRTGRYISSLPSEFQAGCQSHSIQGSVNLIPVLPIPINEEQTFGLAQNPGY